MKFKVTISWTYEPNPNYYDSGDVDNWIATDLEAIKEEPELFIPELGADFDIEVIGEEA